MPRPEPRDVIRILEEGSAVDRAMERAARAAIRRHKRGGVPLVIWENGQIVHVPPEDLPDLPDDPEEGGPPDGPTGSGP